MASHPMQLVFDRGNGGMESSLMFVACHLQKRLYLPSDQRKDSWGLGVQLENGANATFGSSLKIVSLQRDVLNAHLQGSWATSYPPDMGVIWNRSYGSELWVKYFSSVLPLDLTFDRWLQPGDTVIAINGFPLTSLGGSMATISNYFRQCHQLFLVIVRTRHPCPLISSLRPVIQPAGRIQQQIPGAASQLHPPLTNSGRMIHSALSRVVTPCRPSSSTNAAGFEQDGSHGTTQPMIPSSRLQHTITDTASITMHQSNRVESKAAPKHTVHKAKPTVAKCINPMFRAHSNTTLVGISYADNNEDEEEPDGGKNRYLSRIDCSSFASWLQDRKRKWFKHRRGNSSSPSQVTWTNPMFLKETDKKEHMLYCDNHTFDPYDGTRRLQFLVSVNSSNFLPWLCKRKSKWRSKWNISSTRGEGKDLLSMVLPPSWKNPMFSSPTLGAQESDECNRGSNTIQLQYDDNYLFDPDDGIRNDCFLVNVNSTNWTNWLSARKEKWRSTKWNVYPFELNECDKSGDHQQCGERGESNVSYEFWKPLYPSFDCWLAASTLKWKKSYSWNRKKRKRIQTVCEKVVHFPSAEDPQLAQSELKQWLRVRKNQWRILRRKRQRKLEVGESTTTHGPEAHASTELNGSSEAFIAPHPSEKHAAPIHITGDFVHIDVLLEEEERKERRIKEQAPVDITFLFLPSMGCPDDVAASVMEYLHHSEHGKLLCVNKKLAIGLKSRELMWQQLCPASWILPRRPRKPWHELYLSKLRTEETDSRKEWDDLLAKIAEILVKGDQLRAIQRLIEGAEKKFSFTVDYVSGVVLERNSILNFAAIHQRYKVVRWLVETKHADIETSDRGRFTPLMNAAWCGDKRLVRLLLSHGADRRAIGTYHYSQGVAPHDFSGFNSEGWALKKGFKDIAELIRVGL